METDEIKELIEMHDQAASDALAIFAMDGEKSVKYFGERSAKTASALRFLLQEREKFTAALQPFATTAEQIDREVPSARSQFTYFQRPDVDDDDGVVARFPLPDEAFVLSAVRQHDPNPVTEMIVLQMCHLRAAHSALASPQREGDRPAKTDGGGE